MRISRPPQAGGQGTFFNTFNHFTISGIILLHSLETKGHGLLEQQQQWDPFICDLTKGARVDVLSDIYTYEYV